MKIQEFYADSLGQEFCRAKSNAPNPESFSEWHLSETAKLFGPPVFRNEKKATGYFF